MSKLMLLIDEPKTCFDCPCLIVSEGACFCQAKNEWAEGQERPKWCPLRPLPQRYDEGLMREQKGWNRCLDAIIGETE